MFWAHVHILETLRPADTKFTTVKSWAPTEHYNLLFGTKPLRREIVQLAEAFVGCLHEQRLLAFSECLPGTLHPVKTGKIHQLQQKGKSYPLSTIFSTNPSHLQAAAFPGALWTLLRVLLIYALSAVSPMLLRHLWWAHGMSFLQNLGRWWICVFRFKQYLTANVNS